MTARVIIAALMLAVVGCSSTSGGAKIRVNDPAQRDRVMAAKAEAERLLGRKLSSDITVANLPGDHLYTVPGIRPTRKIWTKRKDGGFQGGFHYRGHLGVYHDPRNPAVWDHDAMVEEIGHAILGGTKAADHAAMKAAGFFYQK